jgi:YHS domain-containing protein
MRRSSWVIAAAAVFALGLGISTSTAQHAPGAVGKAATLPNCPVMSDEPIDLSVSTPTDDGPVFFCCPGCIEKYNKDPEKYAKKVAAQRAALKDRPKVQVACPITKKAVDPKVSIEHEGQKVSFCCKGCVSKFQNDPSKYKAGLANSYTYQTKCPVMGGDIDPTASTVLPTGQRIYWCCPSCGEKLMKNPAKYAPMLVAQGININVKKILEAGKKADDHGHDHDHSGHDHGDHGH